MKWIQGIGIVLMLIGSLIKQGWNWLTGKKEDRLDHREIDCSGCGGTGKVTYGPDHEFVQRGWAEPGTYTCSYCGGSGKLVEEIRGRT